MIKKETMTTFFIIIFLYNVIDSYVLNITTLTMSNSHGLFEPAPFVFTSPPALIRQPRMNLPAG